MDLASSTASMFRAMVWLSIGLVAPGACKEGPGGGSTLNGELPLALSAVGSDATRAVEAPGLDRRAWVVGTRQGVPHILAATDHDAYYLQGWVHARDRLFQMDVFRRSARGTLAELLGASALPRDVELRTLGLHRAAERSWGVLSKPARGALEAYAAGVNAYVSARGLPAQYGLLELDTFVPWTAVDSIAVSKVVVLPLVLSSDIEQTVAYQTYRQVGQVAGFDGDALFFEDIYRVAPFDPAATIPDALQERPTAARSPLRWPDVTLALSADYLRRKAQVPSLSPRRAADVGSNTWAVRGKLSNSGAPLLANDPHLPLQVPAVFHQVRLFVPGKLDVIGSGFAGVPGVVLGHNRKIAWGLTVNAVDVTDYFQEQVVPDSLSPSGLSTLYRGQREPIIPLPQTFRYNVLGDGKPNTLALAPPNTEVGGVSIPPVVLIVPRRNQGPIVSLDQATGSAVSIQYTGFSGTREVEAFYRIDRAENLSQFKKGLLAYDTGSLNFSYADRKGHIAYFAAGEVPLREDLQAGRVEGAPPFLLRAGTGGNEWIPARGNQGDRAIPYEIIPPAEMPQLVDPPLGYFINANNSPLGNLNDNDPLNTKRKGGGLLYLDWYYRSSWRAGRIKQLFSELLAKRKNRLTLADMKRIQADTVLRDAQYFVPHLLRAFANAQAANASATLRRIASDERVAEAIGRIRDWDFSTPTGIEQGYDASDVNGRLSTPSTLEIANSVAATVYSVWRAQLIAQTIDATLGKLGLPLPTDRRALVALKQLLDRFSERQGVGASGLDFFVAEGESEASARRDIVLLRSLESALATLAGDAFAAAFGGAKQLERYRWGRLHRVVFAHPLGGPYSIPPAGGAFPPPLAELPGIPTDGGFGTVDAAFHDARALSPAGFTYEAGPARRYVARLARKGIVARTSLPGGQVGVLGDSHYVDRLGRWLTNDTDAMSLSLVALAGNAEEVQEFCASTQRCR